VKTGEGSNWSLTWPLWGWTATRMAKPNQKTHNLPESRTRHCRDGKTLVPRMSLRRPSRAAKNLGMQASTVSRSVAPHRRWVRCERDILGGLCQRYCRI